MARTVRHTTLESRAKRRELEPRGTPYYRGIDPGLHLGYRKISGRPGTWVVRLHKGEKTDEGSPYTTEVIATADDFSDATFSNGDVATAQIKASDILTFAQAQTIARRMRDSRSKSSAGIKGPYTVSKALEDYFKFLRGEGRPEHLVGETEQRAAALIEPKLGDVEVAVLTTKQLRSWRDGLVKVGARVRTKKGKAQQYREIDEDDDDALRARRASANRVWTTLRAALNHAFVEGHAQSDHEWRKVKPFKGVDGKRPMFLTVEEARRLVNASDPDFRRLVQAALQTGGRYGSLARLKVRDFHGRTSTVDLKTRKGDGSEKTFSVILSDEGVQFFRQVCMGRRGDELMLAKAEGSPWEKGSQTRPMEEACKRAKLGDINFNQLRHTWASLALMNGTPLLVVAENLGHSDTRMVEKHYGHITRQYAKERIQEGAPKFGFKPDPKVAALR
jgi:integrase